MEAGQQARQAVAALGQHFGRVDLVADHHLVAQVDDTKVGPVAGDADRAVAQRADLQLVQSGLQGKFSDLHLVAGDGDGRWLGSSLETDLAILKLEPQDSGSKATLGQGAQNRAAQKAVVEAAQAFVDLALLGRVHLEAGRLAQALSDLLGALLGQRAKAGA